MKYSNALPWLPALLVLSACPEPEEPARLSELSVSCAPTVVAGQSVQCSASTTDQRGKTFDVSSLTWTSSDPTVAKVDAATGKVDTLAIASGTVVIRATASAGDVTREADASINVTPKDPTVHATTVTTPEMWREADNPHLVRGRIAVDGSAMLTLEAGVVVRFAPDAELRETNGAILARGTPTAPIRLEAQGGVARGSWRGLVFTSPGSDSKLEHVTVSGCGATGGEGACISVRTKAAPVLRDVSVRESGSVGVLVADDGSAFGAGSARLSVSNSAGYAVRMAANQADSFPTGGTFTGNSPNFVELSGDVSRSQTWPANPGIPFVIPAPMKVDSPTGVVALTISAGTQLRFGANAILRVGINTFHNILNVDGSAEAPVLFTAHADIPAPGHWRGVHIDVNPAREGHISHAIFEFAGAPPTPGHYGTGNLNIYGDYADNASYLLTDVTARRGAGPGIAMLEQVGFGVGSARVKSRENGSYPLTISPEYVHTIPADSGSVWTGNSQDVVMVVDQGVIGSNQTWPNPGVPYLITDRLEVGGSSNPMLTLLPGTELRFKAGASMLMGFRENQPGSLKAEGRADATIRFIPDVLPASGGHWYGLHFWKADGSRLDHVLVTHGGTFRKDFAGGGIIGPANVVVHRELGPFITNSTFRDADGFPICVSNAGGLPGTTRVDTKFLNPEYHNNGADNPNDYQCFYDI
jgi:hypothetical protein